jgi:hypothetical protein
MRAGGSGKAATPPPARAAGFVERATNHFSIGTPTREPYSTQDPS